MATRGRAGGRGPKWGYKAGTRSERINIRATPEQVFLLNSIVERERATGYIFTSQADVIFKALKVYLNHPPEVEFVE